MASKVLSTLGSYERRHRTGDRYVRAMFDCALIFYIDKFGSQGCHWPSRSALSGLSLPHPPAGSAVGNHG
jgi:hypothetical protein